MFILPSSFHDGLSVICYYFPYTHYNHTIFLRKRYENYQCPYNFPMPDPIFQNLCRYANYVLQKNDNSAVYGQIEARD